MSARTCTVIPAETALAAAGFDVAAEGAPKKHIQLLPLGEIKARDGRTWRVDDKAHAQAIIDATRATAGETDLPIDYDHQIPFGAKDGVGGTAPAAGWIDTKTLKVEDDGIWADVEWTAPAAARLAAREYRYISPYFGFDKQSGRVTRIWNAGLVNMPAITELAAVASSQPSGTDMDLKKLATALGLAEAATLAEIETAAAAAVAARSGAQTALATIAAKVGAKTDAKPEQIVEVVATAATKAAALGTIAGKVGAKADAKPEEIVEAVATAATKSATAGDPDPTRFVPMAAFQELQGQVRALQAGDLEEKATAAVDAATAAGKITPAGREHALSLYKKDAVAFAAFIGAQPAVVSPEESAAAAARTRGEITLTEDDRKVGRMMGRTDEQLLAAKKAIG